MNSYNIFEKIKNESKDSKLIINEKVLSLKNKLHELENLEFLKHKKKKVFLILCENDPYLISLYTFLLSKNHVLILVDSLLNNSFLKKIIKDYDPDYVVGKNFFYEKFDLIKKINEICIFKNTNPITKKLYPDLALLLPTSGTTGSSKFVRISHKNLYYNTVDICNYLKINSGDSTITTMPFNYTYGMSIINTHLFKGCKIVFYNGTVLEKRFFDLLNIHKITSFGGVPFIYEMLKKLKFEKLNTNSLKYVTQAGGKMDISLWEYFYEISKLKKIKFISMYGATEATSRMSYLPYEFMLKKKGSIGKGLDKTSLYIVDQTTKKLINKPNHEGEILCKGKNVFLGYAENLKDLELGDKNKEKFYTGDIGYKDKDGFFFISGRKDRFSKILGHRINLDELENIINLKFPKSFVVKREKIIVYSLINHDSEVLINYISKTLNLHKRLFSFSKISEIPLTKNNKINYAKFK